MNPAIVITVSIVLSTVIASLLILVAQTWIKTRIERSITSRYDTQFEQHRRNLQTEHELLLQRVQQAQAMVNNAFVEGQRATAERRVIAVDTIWRGITKLREECPPAVGLLDLYPPDRCDVTRIPEIKNFANETSLSSIIKRIEDTDVKNIRPFIGEACYSLYSCYYALTGRIAYLLITDTPKGKVQPWYKDKMIRGLLSEVLTEEEIVELDSLIERQFNWTRDLLEQKLLEQTSRIISGNTSAEEGLQQARNIQRAINDMSTDTPDTYTTFST